MGQFCINRKPDRRLSILPGKTDGKFHPFLTSWPDGYIRSILIRGQHIAKQARQLHFTPNAAIFDIPHHLLKIPYILGKALERSQAAAHLLKSVADNAHGQGHLLIKARTQLFCILPGYLGLVGIPFPERTLHLEEQDDGKKEGPQQEGKKEQFHINAFLSSVFGAGQLSATADPLHQGEKA